MKLSEVNLFGDKIIPNARVLGLMVGDGYCPGGLLSCDEEIYKYVADRYSLRIRKEFLTKDGKIYREVYVRGILDELRQAGILDYVKDQKRLPKNINEYSKESLCEFLGGYFDADGNVNLSKGKYVRIVLTSAVESLLESVQYSLSKLGIYSTICKEFRKDGYNSNSIIYRLYIQREDSVKKFHQNIHFTNKYKQDVLDLVLKCNSTKVKPKELKFQISDNGKGSYFINKKMSNILDFTITEIEDIGEQTVYNLNAGITHTYLANGFITGNTGGDSKNIEGIRKMSTNPEMFNLLPVRHNYTDTREYIIGTMFFPAYIMALELRDDRG